MDDYEALILGCLLRAESEARKADIATDWFDRAFHQDTARYYRQKARRIAEKAAAMDRLVGS